MSSKYIEAISVYNIMLIVCGIFVIDGIEKVRLTGGPSQYEGAVEIFLNGRWQHVCFDGWNESDAIVVCMQLGASSPSRGKYIHA